MHFNIGDFSIGAGRTFIIAEIGNNHNGSFEMAIDMVERAASAGADCVKFQMRHLDQVYRKSSLEKSGDDLGTEYVVDLLNRFELTVSQHGKIAEYCKRRGVMYMCTPWDSTSADVLNGFGVPAFKVASADLTNMPLLDHLANLRKPLILSTGMSSEDEIKATKSFLAKREVEFVFLHCNSTYPAPLHDINLHWMATLRQIHRMVGYSGHERGIAVTLGAVALGASVIERHFTLDREMEGPDHAASLVEDEFALMVNGIREIEEALGVGGKKRLSQGEMINRENLGKSLVASRALPAGTLIKNEDIKVRSPGQGLSPQKFDTLVGRILLRDVEEEGFFFPSDINQIQAKPRHYKFQRPWGVPVRYHDFNEFCQRISPNIWEFHLSYSDMDIDPSAYIFCKQQAGFVVHAPELFSNSRLMDLASPDDEYRRGSLFETQRVIDITRHLRDFFPLTEKPMIVANVGGFTMDEPLNGTIIREYYERFGESLNELDLEDVELLPQTMAPFPWHFGGQRYQNLFVTIDDIEFWCAELGLRMCFDISHSKLACNHLGYDFEQFSKRIAPLTAHIHLGDASGLNGEGLQIGDGDINFEQLGKILCSGCPEASFIPEIWQGHKNGGEGFWIALERLEQCL